jgi:hypothetical protein
MPAQIRPEIHVALQRQAGKQREISQHLPRPARVRFAVKTKGVGETRLTGVKALDFGALMLDEPTFSFGVVAQEPLQIGQLPLCTATVLSYTKNTNGAWVGAEIAFKVECAKSDVQLKFDLTFEASTLRSTIGNGTNTSTSTATNDYTGADPNAVIQVRDL